MPVISIHHDVCVCVCVCWTQHNPQPAVFTIHLVRTPAPVLRNLYENYYPQRVDVFPRGRSGDGGGAISLNIIITRTYIIIYTYRTVHYYYYYYYCSPLILFSLVTRSKSETRYATINKRDDFQKQFFSRDVVVSSTTHAGPSPSLNTCSRSWLGTYLYCYNMDRL